MNQSGSKTFLQRYQPMMLRSLAMFFVVLLLDICNVFSGIMNAIGCFEFAVASVVIAVFLGIYSRVNVALELPVHSETDDLREGLCGAAVLYLVFEVLAFLVDDKIFAWYKLFGAAVAVMVCLALGRYRKSVIKQVSCSHRETASNTYTLKELYEGQIQKGADELILLEEEAVDYDLLQREELAKSLVRTIENCRPNKKFVLSLSGNWGSGKTTILNIVKKRLQSEKDFIVIDDFDPWNYEDEEALFGAMLDTIFRYAGIVYSVSKLKAWKRDLLALIFNASERTRGVNLSFPGEQETSIAAIQKMMNEYLASSRYRIVFILDNIDRLEDEKLLLLLKTVADVLNLDKVIYILSYDTRVMERVLKKRHLGMEYLKKVVQMEFYVPELDTDIKCNLLGNCMENLLHAYQVNENTRREIMQSIPELAEYMNDVRDVKRFLNSVISVLYSFSDEHGRHLATQLNVVDYIMMELIRRENSGLYQMIWKNAEHFVSGNRESMFEYELLFDHVKEKRNRETKEFFDRLFEREENRRFQKLLQRMFPYVDRYSEGRNILEANAYAYSDEPYVQMMKNHRIYSGNFFPMYFTQQRNEHLDIQQGIARLVDFTNRGEEKEAQDCLVQLCGKYSGAQQMLLFETLQVYTGDLNQQGWEVTFRILYDRISELDDAFLFLKSSARSRATYILSLALDRLTENYFKHFLYQTIDDYKNMSLLQSIIRHKKENGEEAQYTGRAAEIHRNLVQMGTRIAEQKINLYQDTCYRPGNIWGWYHVVKSDPEIDMKEAFRFMLTPKNIFRFLWDMTEKSLGGMYGYRLKKDSMEIFCDVKEVERIMKKVTPSTEDESFVQEIYEAYRDRDAGSDGEIYRSRERKLRL